MGPPACEGGMPQRVNVGGAVADIKVGQNGAFPPSEKRSFVPVCVCVCACVYVCESGNMPSHLWLGMLPFSLFFLQKRGGVGKCPFSRKFPFLRVKKMRFPSARGP